HRFKPFAHFLPVAVVQRRKLHPRVAGQILPEIYEPIGFVEGQWSDQDKVGYRERRRVRTHSDCYDNDRSQRKGGSGGKQSDRIPQVLPEHVPVSGQCAERLLQERVEPDGRPCKRSRGIAETSAKDSNHLLAIFCAKRCWIEEKQESVDSHHA